MAKGYYKKLKKILKDHGCYFLRQGRGDHEVWYSPIVDRPFTLDKGVLSRHTANGTLKDAGIEIKV